MQIYQQYLLTDIRLLLDCIIEITNLSVYAQFQVVKYLHYVHPGLTHLIVHFDH